MGNVSDDSKPRGGRGGTDHHAGRRSDALATIDGKNWRVIDLSKQDVHDLTVESLTFLRAVVAFRGGPRFAQTQVAAAGTILRWTMWATDRFDRLEPPREKAFLDLFDSPEAATRWLSENADRLQRDLSSVTRPPVAHSVAQSAAAAAQEGTSDEAEQRRQVEAHGEHSKDGR